MAASSDTDTRIVGLPELTCVEDQLRQSHLGHVSQPSEITSEKKADRLASIHNLSNGRSLHTMAKSSVSRSYLLDGTIRGERLIHSLRILSGTLPTRMYMA